MAKAVAMFAMFVMAMASLVYFLLLDASNSIIAQNVTNMTTSRSSSLVKMHLEEAVKALESGNKEAASIHLNAGHQAISSIPAQAKEQFEAGMKALSAGDSNGALMHLKAADVKLSADT
jgi:hypothetical protein